MADPPPAVAAPALELTASQERLMAIIRDTDNNVFLTGDAGTGKTFVIEVAKRHLASVGKLYETVAFTGSAAFNANGHTIHAAFHPMPFIPGATPDDRGSTLARSLPELLYQLLSNTVHGAWAKLYCFVEKEGGKGMAFSVELAKIKAAVEASGFKVFESHAGDEAPTF